MFFHSFIITLCVLIIVFLFSNFKLRPKLDIAKIVFSGHWREMLFSVEYTEEEILNYFLVMRKSQLEKEITHKTLIYLSL